MAVRAKLSNSERRWSSTSVAASIRSRCSSSSVCVVMRALTKYTAAPIDSIASRALARKMRLVIEPRKRISRKYNPRVWMVLAAVVLVSIDLPAVARSRRGRDRSPDADGLLPPGKTLRSKSRLASSGSKARTGRTRKLHRASRPERRATRRVPLAIEDRPARVRSAPSANREHHRSCDQG